MVSKASLEGARVRAATSSESLQPRHIHNGRAEPLISRRRPCLTLVTTPAALSGLPGVWGAARTQGLIRNRRDPSWQPTSGKDRSYKPMVKSNGVKRESEGVVVPVTGVQHNTPVGKGPYFDHASQGGKHEGMGHEPNLPEDKVRQLQTKLWAAAKQSPVRRFHALYDRISRDDVLEQAWKRVRDNRGAAGVDKQTLADIEAYGVDRLLAELKRDLEQKTYRPQPVLRQYIAKPDGGARALGIPTVRDRIAQLAAKMILEPIFEADFLPSSYGYRPRLSPTDALEKVRTLFPSGHTQVLDADIADFFTSIDHDLLMKRIKLRISDRRMLKLLRLWLKAGVMEGGRTHETVEGTPQGGVISPLLANIYLHALDEMWVKHGVGVLVRYADDLVVMCKTQAQVVLAEKAMKDFLVTLGLELNATKTRKADLREGRQGFDFLGCHFRARVSGKLLEQGVRRYYLHRWPSTASMKRVRQKVKKFTGHNRSGQDVRMVIKNLNPILRGWGNYFRTGNAANKFIQIDRYVQARFKRLIRKRYGRNLRPHHWKIWTDDWFKEQGLHRLRGTIRYPGVRNCA